MKLVCFPVTLITRHCDNYHKTFDLMLSFILIVSATEMKLFLFTFNLGVFLRNMHMLFAK